MVRTAAFIALIALLAHTSVYSHPGRTDANGGHYNRKTGEYHYHNSSRDSAPAANPPTNSFAPRSATSKARPENSARTSPVRRPPTEPERFNWHHADGSLAAYGYVTAAYDRQGWQVWIKKREGSTVNLKLAELSVADRAVILVGSRQAEFKERYRTWTNETGKYTAVAKAMSVDSNGVQLRRADDKRIVTVPLQKLSDADRAFAIRLLNAAELAPSKLVGDNPFESTRRGSIESPQQSETAGRRSTSAPSSLWSTGRPLTQSVARAAPEVSSAALNYWLNTESGIRHNRSCRWYGKTKSGRPCSASEGSDCGQCGG